MDKQMEQDYENLLELFNQQGWGVFNREVIKFFESLRDAAQSDCKTNDEWQYRRGQLDVLNYFSNYEALIKHAYQDAINNPVDPDEISGE